MHPTKSYLLYISMSSAHYVTLNTLYTCPKIKWGQCLIARVVSRLVPSGVLRYGTGYVSDGMVLGFNARLHLEHRLDVCCGILAQMTLKYNWLG